MPSEQKNFLGIPIEGDISLSSSKKVQDPPELLQEAMQQLVQHPGFEAMRWRQYTPYFNDGDPCVFNIYSVYFRFTGMDPVTEEQEGAWEEEDGFYSVRDGRYHKEGSPERRILGVTSNYGIPISWEQEPEDIGLIELADEVYTMITSGKHWDFLYTCFGDHATVTMKKNVIEVDEYEHD